MANIIDGSESLPHRQHTRDGEEEKKDGLLVQCDLEADTAQHFR